MIDLGNPFSKPYATLIRSLEESVRQGVEQPARDQFVLQSSITAYELRRPAHDVSQVQGLVQSTPTVFQIGIDFRFSNNRIQWIEGPAATRPDDGSRWEVQYTYRERPAGLTDFNEGSVIGTLVRAAAREMAAIYEQIDQAYRRAFIDHAQGAALDNVVALLGIARNPPIPAVGQITFFRKKAPPANQAVVIPVGTRITDASNRSFATTAAGAITSDSQDAVGQFSVTVPIVAQQPGPEGNVNAETITIMPTPPRGVEGVINREPTSGGTPAETDEQLRQRAKFHLERLGNATLNALKFAVLDVDGVEGVEVSDHSVDSSIPLGEVRIHSIGGDIEQIRRVVEETRAAGVMAVLSEITEVLVEGIFYVIPSPSVPASAATDFKAAVVDAINALTIGEPLSLRRLSALVYGIGGLADVAEAQLQSGGAALPDPFLIKRDQVIRPNEASLEVTLLTALRVVGVPRRVTGANELDVELVTQSGTANLQNFRLDLTITARARLKTAPDQPAAILGSLSAQAAFLASAPATLQIQDANVMALGFDPAVHDTAVTITIRATVFPGLAAAETTIDLS
jgi:uncharacterized phage protein gp47/JayE